MKINNYFPQKSILILIMFFSSWITSCGRNNDENLNNNLSDLAVNIEIIGKSSSFINGDGTGVIKIFATAKNASSFNMRIGSDILSSQDGKFNYTVNNSGTNSYTIYVTAYNGDKSISNTTQITVYKTPKLLWSDEFDKDGLPDSTKWGYDTGNNNGWGNNELEYYTNRQENANVSNGILKINLIKESYQGFNYTSARLLSKGKFSFKYGRIDIRAKLASGGGTWPALWMLGDNITSAGWPACGEIDIMEHVGNQLNKIYATLHHPNHSGANGDGGTVNISNATSEFHIYSLDWSSDQIKFYVDNQLFYTFANNSNLPFNQNFFLIMNVAMGGNFGGTVDSNFTSSSMEIDYVRVYQ